MQGCGAKINERNDCVDCAKGVGIILVVLGHNSLLCEERGWLFNVIFSFHVPLFFFLAGLFLKTNISLWTLFVKKFFGLVVPYFAASALQISLRKFWFMIIVLLKAWLVTCMLLEKLYILLRLGFCLYCFWFLFLDGL